MESSFYYDVAGRRSKVREHVINNSYMFTDAEYNSTMSWISSWEKMSQSAHPLEWLVAQSSEDLATIALEISHTLKSKHVSKLESVYATARRMLLSVSEVAAWQNARWEKLSKRCERMLNEHKAIS